MASTVVAPTHRQRKKKLGEFLVSLSSDTRWMAIATITYVVLAIIAVLAFGTPRWSH
jgi:hypothetical protein